MSDIRQPGWSLSLPADEAVERFRAGQQSAPFSYVETGASLDGSPAGYQLDHNRVQLGRGEKDFEAGCAALRRWQMFPAPWTRISPVNAPIAVGTVVAMQAHALGIWWLNACRIVYVLDEFQPARRFGFAYGTLDAHVEQGEERFFVEMLPDGTVWYDVRAFSRPRYWPVRLAKPIARRLQRRFVWDSKEAMMAAVRKA